MASQLQADGSAVVLDARISIQTPGLSGVAEVHRPDTAAIKLLDTSATPLSEALKATSLSEYRNIVLSDTTEAPRAAAGPADMSADTGPAPMQVDVELDAAQRKTHGQVLMFTDEYGVITWHLPEAKTVSVRAAPAVMETGDNTVTFLVPRRITPPSPVNLAPRSLVKRIRQKLLRIFVYPLIDTVAGQVGGFFVARWEKKKRWYRLRSFTPDDYTQPGGTTIGDQDWSRLATGPALMLVHGTLSRASSGFSELPRAILETLHTRYQGRVFAFDHPTASKDPKQNIDWLIEQIPEGADLQLDILCHSRGGLVGRTLAEQFHRFTTAKRSIVVRRVVFVATPNAGTPLVDAKYLGNLVNNYTNLLNLLPDHAITITLEGLITVLKQLATGTLDGLVGLQSMLPNGPFLEQLNQGAAGGSAYFAAASNYEPTDPGIKALIADHTADKIFKQQHNDLIVPTDGVFEGNGSGSFPIEERIVLDATKGVGHFSYFDHADIHSRLLEWLPG